MLNTFLNTKPKIPRKIDSKRILASFDDQNPTLVEKEYGRGRVLCFTSSIDREWTDMPIHAVYLPFLHETIKHLTLTKSTQTINYLVGDVIELNNYNLPAGTEAAIFNPQRNETRLKISEFGSTLYSLSLIHISEPTRLGMISYAVFC